MQALATRIRGPVAVIGDVHGQADKLAVILDRLDTLPDFSDRWIVFLGDLVDRGPDPKAVVDMVVDLRRHHPRTTVICGNHELAMGTALGWLPSPEYSPIGDQWIGVYDSETTFDSYGAAPGDLDDLAAKIPQSHEDLLAELPWCVEHPDYFFVHAGLDPNTPFEMQVRALRQRDFSLSRPQWLCSHSLATNMTVPVGCRQTVVTGHVRVPRVTFEDRRLCVDTTGGLSGDLSCVLLPEKKVITSSPQKVAAETRRGWNPFRRV